MTDSGRIVAIVDDHPTFRQTAARCLTILGYSVILEAPNGMIFLQQLENSPVVPDICLLDIEMPVMDGVATARVLRERFPQIKIVAYTLSPDNTRKESILRAGARGIISKYMDPEEIQKTLLQALVD